MFEDSGLDSFMESHINAGAGDVPLEDACPSCACNPCRCVGNDVSEHADEPPMCEDCGQPFDPANDGDTCPTCANREAAEPDDSMDGDAESALASAGFGTDEDYGGGTHDWECGGDCGE